MSYGSIFAEPENKNAFYGLLTQSPTATGWAKRPKLTLLFDSTRDGWTGPVFHQKCDGQGPTVSVCRTQNGTVCGGFTQVNWGSPNGAYQKDPSAFLFRLKLRGTAAPYRSGVGKRSHDVYCNTNYGPTFGSNHYYNPTIANPLWGRGSPHWEEHVVIGHHVFGRCP